MIDSYGTVHDVVWEMCMVAIVYTLTGGARPLNADTGEIMIFTWQIKDIKIMFVTVNTSLITSSLELL